MRRTIHFSVDFFSNRVIAKFAVGFVGRVDRATKKVA